ncbi:hypothetical protein [Sagittula sp. S175]|uniref:hypothetical protein n=1 Tax=Sagittula sp. S175 TaxID=3415129 RepID=UPI003C7B8715
MQLPDPDTINALGVAVPAVITALLGGLAALAVKRQKREDSGGVTREPTATEVLAELRRGFDANDRHHAERESEADRTHELLIRMDERTIPPGRR